MPHFRGVFFGLDKPPSSPYTKEGNISLKACVNYSSHMIQVLRTAAFDEWLQALRDQVAKKQVLARLTRLSLGNWGDCKPVGGEVTELRIDSGPGYRVYCWRNGEIVVIALGGGDKSTQQRDIEKVQAMVQELKG